LPIAERIENQRRQRQPPYRGQIAGAAERKIPGQRDRQKPQDEGIGIEEHGSVLAADKA
jgi:hypothetical protein